MKMLLVIATTMIVGVPTSQAANYCGELANAYGPFDYSKRSEFASSFRLVESAHFTTEVERLIKGSTGSLGGDLDYTLRAIPNHARALASIARLGLREKATRVSGAKWSIECYFNRAVRFKPDDAGVRNLYGSYLFKLGRIDEAHEQLNEALRLDPENGAVNYNIGLLYLEKKDYDKALTFAKKADTLGVPLTGLKNKLIEMGKEDVASRK